MSINVMLSSFGKRKNSTARPTSFKTVTGEIKSPCSTLSPVITFNLDGSPTNYNYAYIGQFQRYYWVNDWQYVNGLWLAHMRVDPLASWKTDIGKTWAYILRSSSRFDGNITDTAYPPKTGIRQRIAPNLNSAGYGWSGYYESGSIVVGIINGATNTVGCVSYYVFTIGQFRTFCAKLFDDPSDYLNIDPTEMSENMQRAMINPFQYIASAYWFPFEVAHKSTISTLKFGWWEFTHQCAPIADYAYSLNELSFQILKHPEAATRGEYLNESPYTNYSLFIPAFGEIDLPSAALNGYDKVVCDIVTDSITGVGNLRIKRQRGTETPEQLYIRSGQVGVPVQLAGMNGSIISGALGQMSREMFAGTGIASKILGAVGLAETVGNTLAGLESQMTTLSTVGTNGSTSVYYYPPKLTSRYLEQTAENIDQIGRPLCETRQINTVNGFVLCRDGEFGGAATTAEIEQINNHMTSGFYFE